MTRPKGKVIYRSLDNPEIHKAVREAHKAVVAERVRLQTQRAERGERPVPNWKADLTFSMPGLERLFPHTLYLWKVGGAEKK